MSWKTENTTQSEIAKRAQYLWSRDNTNSDEDNWYKAENQLISQSKSAFFARFMSNLRTHEYGLFKLILIFSGWLDYYIAFPNASKITRKSIVPGICNYCRGVILKEGVRTQKLIKTIQRIKDGNNIHWEFKGTIIKKDRFYCNRMCWHNFTQGKVQMHHRLVGLKRNSKWNDYRVISTKYDKKTKRWKVMLGGCQDCILLDSPNSQCQVCINTNRKILELEEQIESEDIKYMKDNLKRVVANLKTSKHTKYILRKYIWVTEDKLEPKPIWYSNINKRLGIILKNKQYDESEPNVPKIKCNYCDNIAIQQPDRNMNGSLYEEFCKPCWSINLAPTCEYYNCDNLVDARYDKTKCEYDDRKNYCTQHRPEYGEYSTCIECREHLWGKNPKGLEISNVGFSRICKGGRYKCHTCINECREYGPCSWRRGCCGCYMESRR